MILIEIVAAALLLSMLTGGSLSQLEEGHIRGQNLLVILLPAQLVWPRAAQLLDLSCSVTVALWLVMMAGLFLLLLMNAPKSWALGMAALGIAANILVIGLNGAMPVNIRAASEMGVTRSRVRTAFAADCLHEELAQDTRLKLLADNIAVPGPTWQRGVVSLGDILLAAGLASWVWGASRTPRA